MELGLLDGIGVSATAGDEAVFVGESVGSDAFEQPARSVTYIPHKQGALLIASMAAIQTTTFFKRGNDVRLSLAPYNGQIVVVSQF